MVYCILPTSMFAAKAASLCAAAATPSLLASTIMEPASGLIKYGTALTVLVGVLNGCGSMPSQPIALQNSSEETPTTPERGNICQGPPYSAKVDYGKTALDWHKAEGDYRGCGLKTTSFCISAELDRFFPKNQQNGENNLEGIRIITLETNIDPKEFDKELSAKGLRTLTLNETMQLAIQCTNVLEEELFAAGSAIYDGPDYAVPNIYIQDQAFLKEGKRVKTVNRYHTHKLQKGWRIPVTPKSE